MRAAILMLLVPAFACAQEMRPYRVDRVHADIRIAYASGGWTSNVKLDTALPQYNNQLSLPASRSQLQINLTSSTKANQPTSTSFNFIGAGSGNEFRRLSQNNLTPSQLFLGLDSSGMDAAPGAGWANWQPSQVSANPAAPTASSKYVEYIIKEVRAPAGGQFSAWFASGGTPKVYASTFERGFSNSAGQNSLFVPLNGHTHLNWGFTELGKYEVDFTARTFYLDGNGVSRELASNPLTPFTFKFEVGKLRSFGGDGFGGLPPPPVPFASEPVPQPSMLLVVVGIVAVLRFRQS